MLALVRQGTQTPIAAFDVSSGKGVVGDRCTEADFATFLDQLLASASPQIAPQISWRIVCDRLRSPSMSRSP